MALVIILAHIAKEKRKQMIAKPWSWASDENIVFKYQKKLTNISVPLFMSVPVNFKSLLFVTLVGIGSGYYIWKPLVKQHYEEVNRRNQEQQEQEGQQGQQQSVRE